MERSTALLAAIVALVSARTCAVPAEDGSLPLLSSEEVERCAEVVAECEAAASGIMTRGLPVLDLA